MQLSKYPLITYKETPVDAELTSHQLMLRAGLIKKLASGLFSLDAYRTESPSKN